MNGIALANYNLFKTNQNDLVFKQSYFQDYLEFNKGRSKTTCQNYINCLKVFVAWIKENDIQTPTRRDCQHFRDYLENSSLTEGTKQQYFRAMKHFFRWISSEGMFPNVAENIKGFKVTIDNSKKDSLTENEIKKIIEGIDTTTETGKRNKAIILLMVTCGLRVNETRLIDLQDIEEREGQKRIYIQGKGHKEKDDFVKMIPEVEEAIEDYLSTRPQARKEEPLFTNASNNGRGQRITSKSFSRLVKNILKDSGFNSSRLTSHSLRHTSNTLLYLSGADLLKVQQHARHKDPKTTEIYIHKVEKQKDTSEQDIYNQIFNRQLLKSKRELLEEVNSLSEEELQKVALYIQKIKGGIENEGE